MRYLFIHQNFPAQFLHLARHLAAQQRHDIVFVTEANKNNIPGVRKVVYAPSRKPAETTHRDAVEFEAAMLRAEAVAVTCQNLRSLGYQPDIIIGHHGWGELLNIGDVWPGVPILGYQEFYYHADGLDVGFDPEFPTDPASLPRIRAKNTVNLLALTNAGHGQTPTSFQHSTYPEWARERITVLREGVNLTICRPDPAARRQPFRLGDVTIGPDETLVTYVARDLEPYRGFHVFMRALPHLLRGRSDLHVILAGGDGVSYGARLAFGTWRERLMGEVGAELDMARTHFVSRLEYADYVRLLQRSDCHVYLTYPFVASWSLREAIACGCAVVASDTAPVAEFVTDRKNGLLTPFHEPKTLAERVLSVLESRSLSDRLRQGARSWAEKNLDMTMYLAKYETLIRSLVGGK